MRYSLRLINVLTLSVVAAAIMLSVSGCRFLHCIEGNEMVTSEHRPTSNFSGIVSEGSFKVYIIQDSVNEIIVEAESNLLPYIDTWLKGSTLILKEQDNRCLNNHYPMVITVRTKSVDFVKLSGSGDIYGNSNFVTDYLRVELSGSGLIDVAAAAPNVETYLSGSGLIRLNIQGDHLISEITGSGEMDLYGNVHKGDLTITGSGNVHAYGLSQDICFATITGSGNMFVTIIDLLDVNISGSGSVHYKGNPDVNLNITGSGTVIHE
jgi:hypothetical protein